MKYFMGIDVGGTNVKFGEVTSDGEILKKKKYPSAEVGLNGAFVENFVALVKKRLDKSSNDIREVGIGLPGTISEDRSTVLEVPNIPTLRGAKLLRELEKKIPKVNFHLENDANAAALGEFYFGKAKLPPTFMFITLGTGVGGGAIINKKIFKGGDGNGMEIGHIVASNGKTIEENIGKKGMIGFVREKLKSGYKSVIVDDDDLSSKVIAAAAEEGDPLALEVYQMYGKYLGELIVSCVRILDIKTILIGGGVAEAYDHLEESMNKTIHQYLTPYYTDHLDIKLATLANKAGIIGAASLCFQ
ncbi:ROK family protein [Limibacter armeniacum]|uniref:ROK family protein n=1 Tax=Limibacter armeniacum TaxID=466084 RepID=UPI002FE62E39